MKTNLTDIEKIQRLKKLYLLLKNLHQKNEAIEEYRICGKYYMPILGAFPDPEGKIKAIVREDLEKKIQSVSKKLGFLNVKTEEQEEEDEQSK